MLVRVVPEEIGAQERSCAEAIFGSVSDPPFHTSHLESPFGRAREGGPRCGWGILVEEPFPASQAIDDPGQVGYDVSKREGWAALAECWIKPSEALARSIDGVGSVEISVLNGEVLSYARTLNAPILDLRYLSSRAT